MLSSHRGDPARLRHHAPCIRSNVSICPAAIPTVSLDVISLVASNYGYSRGSNRATRCALIRGALGDTEKARKTSTTPPSAARSARCTHAGASQQTSTADPEELYHSGTPPRAGTTRWPHTGGETTQALQVPRDARPARRSSFRLLAMASPQLDARRKLLI